MVTWHASWLKIENEGNWYPGCQRVFMRGFRFRSSLKKCFATRVIALRPKKFLVEREKKPLVPSAGNCWRIYFLWINKLAFLIEDKHGLLPTFEINVYWPPPPPPPPAPRLPYDHLGNVHLIITATFFGRPSKRPYIFLSFFNWSAMDSHSKHGVLELLNMNKNNVIIWFFFLNPSPIWQLFTNQPTWYLYSKILRTMSSLCVPNFNSFPSSFPKI